MADVAMLDRREYWWLMDVWYTAHDDSQLWGWSPSCSAFLNHISAVRGTYVVIVKECRVPAAAAVSCFSIRAYVHSRSRVCLICVVCLVTCWPGRV